MHLQGGILMSLLETLASMAVAGTMLVSSALDAAAPQNDIDGTLFLVNRQWRVSSTYVPETDIADVSGQPRQIGRAHV